MSKKVLIIAYYFPPLAGPGIVKIVRSCRHLPQFGWNPIVLSVSNPEKYPKQKNAIPDDVIVKRAFRIPGIDFLARALDKLGIGRKWIAAPDIFWPWIPDALLQGWQIIKKERPDLIYTTVPPYSSAIIATLLSKMTKLPLVVDIRDPWLEKTNPLLSYPTPLHKSINEKLERFVINQANSITFIYEIGLNQYRVRYPEKEKKLHLIRPGFDGDEIPQRSRGSCEENSIRIIYTGSFYTPYKTLKIFFEGLALYNQANQPSAELHYYGPLFGVFNEYAANAHALDKVHQYGYVSIADALQAQLNADILLIVLEFSTIPTKIYESLASQVPIIVIAPEIPELHDLLDSYAENYRYIHLEANAIDIALAIQSLAATSSGPRTKDEKKKLLWSDLEIRPLTQKLVEIFDGIQE